MNGKTIGEVGDGSSSGKKIFRRYGFFSEKNGFNFFVIQPGDGKVSKPGCIDIEEKIIFIL